jgi:hypothetical protein
MIFMTFVNSNICEKPLFWPAEADLTRPESLPGAAIFRRRIRQSGKSPACCDKNQSRRDSLMAMAHGGTKSKRNEIY